MNTVPIAKVLKYNYQYLSDRVLIRNKWKVLLVLFVLTNTFGTIGTYLFQAHKRFRVYKKI